MQFLGLSSARILGEPGMPVIVHLVKSRNLWRQIRYQTPLQRLRRSFSNTSFAEGTKADCRAYLRQQRVRQASWLLWLLAHAPTSSLPGQPARAALDSTLPGVQI